MPISSPRVFDVKCECGKEYHTSDEHVGRYVNCGCGRRVPIQLPAPVESHRPLDDPGRPGSGASYTARRESCPGRAAPGKAKLFWQGIVFPWKLISILVLCSVSAGVAFWAYRSHRPDNPPLPEGYALDKASGFSASPEGGRQDAEPAVVSVAPPIVVSPRPAPVTTGRSSIRAPQDIGFDVAIPRRAQIPIMNAPSRDATRVLTVGSRDTLALVERNPTDGWFNVVHVSSGKEGWVNETDVRLAFTKNPLPPPVFSEEYVGRDAAPVLKVINKTDRELSLRIDDARYTVASGKHLDVSYPGGACKFFASAPGAMPVSGTKEWKRGYSYEWTFWIETRILPVPIGGHSVKVIPSGR